LIEKIEISGIHAHVDPKLHAYTLKKIGRLDRFFPKNARQSAHAEIKLKEAKTKDKKQCTCEVILHLPHETIMVKESTMNMFAAVDIVETTLKNKLKSYKDKHTKAKFHRRLLSRFKRGEISI
jgi:ribosomal subunit interface protein